MENSKSRTKAISLLLVVSSVLVFLALWDFPRESRPSNFIREL
jgi:hypothetical protein